MKHVTAAQAAIEEPLRIAELAQVAKVSESTIRTLVRDGAIQTVRIGKQIRIPRREALRLLGERQ